MHTKSMKRHEVCTFPLDPRFWVIFLSLQGKLYACYFIFFWQMLIFDSLEYVELALFDNLLFLWKCQELNGELRRCKDDFKEFERQDLKYREDFKHLKTKMKKLDDKFEKVCE